MCQVHWRSLFLSHVVPLHGPELGWGEENVSEGAAVDRQDGEIQNASDSYHPTSEFIPLQVLLPQPGPALPCPALLT